MTTLEKIVNPIPYVLAAWKKILEKPGHTVHSVSAFDLSSVDSKLSPYKAIQISSFAASGQEYPLGNDRYWSSWNATLSTHAVTNRGKNGEQHIILVGSIYVLAAQFRRLFTPAVLPFHKITHMRPSGYSPDTEGLLDYSKIDFDIIIMVRDDAWPQD